MYPRLFQLLSRKRKSCRKCEKQVVKHKIPIRNGVVTVEFEWLTLFAYMITLSIFK